MPTLIARLDEGHRQEYVKVLSQLFAQAGVVVRVRKHAWKFIFDKEPIFFLMIEEGPLAFFFIAVVRAALNRRTAGLLFRPADCLSSCTPRLRAKRTILQLLRKSTMCTVMTLIPKSIDERIDSISRRTLHDPQLWDIGTLYPDAGSSDAALAPITVIRETAAGRKVCLALGLQSSNKGFDFFCKAWSSSEELRATYQFVAAGILSEAVMSTAREFEKAGGMVIPRHLTNEEVIALYGVADVIWACYAPEYDQASGIFGRAFQLGVTSVVRRGSYLQRLAALLGYSVIPVAWNSTEEAVSGILHADECSRREQNRRGVERLRVVERLRKESAQEVFSALGVSNHGRAK